MPTVDKVVCDNRVLERGDSVLLMHIIQLQFKVPPS